MTLEILTNKIAECVSKTLQYFKSIKPDLIGGVILGDDSNLFLEYEKPKNYWDVWFKRVAEKWAEYDSFIVHRIRVSLLIINKLVGSGGESSINRKNEWTIISPNTKTNCLY